MLPAFQDTRPELFNVRVVSVAAPLIVNTPLLLMVVAAAPLIVPPAQFNAPFTVRLPVPVRTLLPMVSTSTPFVPTALAAFSVRTFWANDKVCKPLTPPIVMELTVRFTPFGDVTV